MKHFYRILRPGLSVLILCASSHLLHAQFTLQILHSSDGEGGVEAIGSAPRFAAIIDTLEGQYTNTMKLSAGDNWISGPFYSSADVASVRDSIQKVYGVLLGSIRPLREGPGRIDVSILNVLGYHASALGNHEFDLGTAAIQTIIAPEVRSATDIRWTGNFFPYLSANLSFSGDNNLSGIFESSIREHTFFKFDNANVNAKTKSVAPATIVTINGQKIGVVGATTPLLARISSPGNTSVKNPGANTNDMPALATILQPFIDSLVNNHGVNKVVLVTHLQQFQLEEALAPLLRGIDVIIAGGSDGIFANPGQRLHGGDAAVRPYPNMLRNKDGDPVAVVSTDGQYTYVGRLVLTFDAMGRIDTTLINRNICRPFPTDSVMVDSLYNGNYAAGFSPNSKGGLVKTLTDAVSGIVAAKDGLIVGKTDVFLEGRREKVRTEETNFGNLSCDANLWQARQYDAATVLSLKNGGGIRAAIGEVVESKPGIYETTKPKANPLSGKKEGEVSQLDMENTMKFNNRLTIVSLKPSGIKRIFEHGVAAWAPGATPGQNAQIGGGHFSFDPASLANQRIVNFVVVDQNGNPTDTIVKEGLLFGDTNRIIKLVTLNFLAGGGDAYPFSAVSQGMVQIDTVGLSAGQFTFTPAGSEQDALAEYMHLSYSTTPYKVKDTPAEEDLRIQNLSKRADQIFPVEVDFDAATSEVHEDAGMVALSIPYRNSRSTSQTVNIHVNRLSTATLNTDYSLSANSFTAQAGSSGTFTLNVNITDDSHAEEDEFVILEIDPADRHLSSDNFHIVYLHDNDRKAPVPSKAVELRLIDSFKGLMGGGNTTEIIAFDKTSKRLFVANSSNAKLEILDFSNPDSTKIHASIDVSAYGNINSVAVSKDGVVACAMEASNPQSPGKIVFFDTDGTFKKDVAAGVLPDMVTFTHDGKMAIAACEGEPNDDYDVDPEGSITLVDLSAGITQATSVILDFNSFDSQINTLRQQGMRFYGNNGQITVSKDMEPEYVAVSPDDKIAYVTCQENNALVIVDLATKSISNLVALGYKNHAVAGNGLDANRNLANVFIGNFPVHGIYHPDAISAFNVGGQTYIVSANEGDSRDYDGYSEEVRFREKDYKLDRTAFPNPKMIYKLIGDINVTKANGDSDNDGDYEDIFVYGARSFSLWNGTTGALVYDSGNELEMIASSHPIYHPLFNASNGPSANTRNRSDDKGPEPEAVVVGELSGKHYAFIGAERSGGVFVFDVTNPAAPAYVDHHNNRDTATGDGDLAPEGLVFIPHTESPNKLDMLVVANEVSATITIYHVFDPQLDTTTSPNIGIQHLASNVSVEVYPNPVNEVLNVRSQASDLVLYALYDVQGRLAESATVNTGRECSINVSAFKSGVYILQLQTTDGQTRRPIVIR